MRSARPVSGGVAVVDGELEEGLMAVAVPIRNRNGDVIASLNSNG